MKLIVSVLALFLFLSACNSSSDQKSDHAAANIKTVLKPFSDSTKLDSFKVELSGDKPKNMQLTFRIVAFNGQEIYQKVLKASDLINNYKETVDLSKENSQRKFMTEEFNLFFDDENFLEPAVAADEKPDQYTDDKTFYEELKRSNLNGFSYRISKETKVYIAWSALEKKVKIYYKCC